MRHRALHRRYGHAGTPGVPVRALATKEGMMKGYWKVIVVDADGHEVERLETTQTKKAAVECAAWINEHGTYRTGISGFRYDQKLGQPLRRGAT